MNLSSLIEPLKNVFIGKTNRHDFLLSHIVFIGIMFFLILTTDFVPNILIIVAVIISFVLQIRRMNDIGKNGWFLLKLYWNYIILISLCYLIINTAIQDAKTTDVISCIDYKVDNILMYLNHPDKDSLNTIKELLRKFCDNEKIIDNIKNIENYVFNFINTTFVIILAYFLFKKSNSKEKVL